MKRPCLGGVALSIRALRRTPASRPDAPDHAGTPAIKARGTLRVAVDIGHPPYGMLDAQAQATGSDIETAQLLADDLGVKLEGRAGFRRQSRAVPARQQGRHGDRLVLDHRRAQEGRGNYSKPYGVIPVVISAPKAMAIASSPPTSPARTIAVARGTTADIELTRAPEGRRRIGASIVRYEDEATTNTAVATGQQDVFSAALSTANSVAEQNADKNLEVKLTLAAYPMAIGLRKNDPELKSWADEWVAANLANGKLNQIYVKYFNQNLPESIPE
ncbi:MAG: transporter substrate-binding domain-containing protein [Candidatus Kaistia colombiensis]|nr:MAG: transporter substrate-binding domain-containing protein [Kaistia sp.]